MDTTEIEFRLDIFAVIMPTDADMAGLTNDRARAYDSLMNNHYGRLSGLLKEDDRKVLVHAQRVEGILRHGNSYINEISLFRRLSCQSA